MPYEEIGLKNNICRQYWVYKSAFVSFSLLFFFFLFPFLLSCFLLLFTFDGGKSGEVDDYRSNSGGRGYIPPRTSARISDINIVTFSKSYKCHIHFMLNLLLQTNFGSIISKINSCMHSWNNLDF